MMLLLVSTPALATSQAIRVNEGDTLVAEMTGVFISSAAFIGLVATQESEKFLKLRIVSMQGVIDAHEDVVDSKNKRIVWLGEEYADLLQLHKDRPTDDWQTQVGKVGLALTAGFALCEFAQ